MDRESQGDAAAVCHLTAPSGDTHAAWEEWTSFKGQRLKASSTAESMPAFAWKIENGVAVCISNLTDRPADAKISLSLPGGAYQIERLVFSQASSTSQAHVERLQGSIVTGKSTVTKPLRLEGGDATIYRITNLSRASQAAYSDIKVHLAKLHQSRASEYRRIMVPLKECWDNLGALSSGISAANRYDRLKQIHRALLTLAHAQSLCRNYRNEGRIDETTGGALMAALDRLQNSLADTSAVCLNLVPNIETNPVDPADPAARKVTISIANGGEREVSLVRIGAAGPNGAKIEPADEAMFPTLKPGETVRATFSIRLPEGVEQRACTAQIGYFTARSPAHLRVPLS